MSERFVMVDRDTPMMMPPSLQEWLPEGHLAYFVVETVALLPLNGIRVNTRGTGHAQFPPSMMLALLVYNYAVGRMSSRQIEKATYEDVASRYVCGGGAHPDHDTVCTFRRVNGALFEESFVRVLEDAPPGLSGTDAMRRRLRTASGRATYKKRKETVEPFFGIVKAAMGFRTFLLRGLAKVNLEWTLVRLAYNFRRLAKLLAAMQGPDRSPMTPRTA